MPLHITEIFVQFCDFMMNFIINLLQFGSFVINVIKIQLSFAKLRKISENTTIRYLIFFQQKI